MHLSDYLQIWNSHEIPSLESWNEVDPNDPSSLEALLAAANGDVVSLAAVLDQGIKVDSRFDFALWETVNPDEKAIMRQEKGIVSADESKPISITLLHAAAKVNQVSIIRLLLERGAGVDLVSRPREDDFGGITALFHAVANGNLDAARCLLDAGATPNVWGYHDGRCYTLLAVCLYGWLAHQTPGDLVTRVEILGLLLESGADVTYQPYPCESSISAAVHCNRLDIVQEMHRRGAPCERTLYEFVCGSGSEQLLDYLVVNGACDLQFAMSGSTSGYNDAQIKAASQVLDRFPSFIGTQESYRASLSAATRGDVAMLDLLVRRGLDINGIDDSSGLPCLCAAIQNRNLQLVRWLLSKGADVHLRHQRDHWTVIRTCDIVLGRTTQTMTPLHIATNRWDQDIVECLLDAGADVNAHSRGVTPLMNLCTRSMRAEHFEDLDCSRAVATLVRAGADVNVKLGPGHTSLHLVAWLTGHDQRRADLARALLENGASPYAETVQRELPAHMALSRQDSDSTPLLIDVLAEHTSDYEYVIGLMENDLG